MGQIEMGGGGVGGGGETRVLGGRDFCALGHQSSPRIPSPEHYRRMPLDPHGPRRTWTQSEGEKPPFGLPSCDSLSVPKGYPPI